MSRMSYSYRKFTLRVIFSFHMPLTKMRKGLEAEGCSVSQRPGLSVVPLSCQDCCGSRVSPLVSPPCPTKGPGRTRHCVTVSHLAWGKLLSLHATVHPLWQRTDSPSVWYCKGAFINVSKAFRTVAVEPVQCEVTLSVL